MVLACDALRFRKTSIIEKLDESGKVKMSLDMSDRLLYGLFRSAALSHYTF